MAEVSHMEIPRARRREIALAMVAAMREQEKQGAAANISPPGIKVLLELFDERAEEIAKLREEASRMAQKLVALEGEGDGAGDREVEAETDQRTIASLRKDLEEERTWNNRLRVQVEEMRALVSHERAMSESLREQTDQLELAAKHHQGIAETERKNAESLCKERDAAFVRAGQLSDAYAALKASAKDLVERAQGQAFGAERRLEDEAAAHGATRLELAAAVNDRSLLELRLNDMAERFADLSELVLQEDNGPGVVVIELGVQIL